MTWDTLYPTRQDIYACRIYPVMAGTAANMEDRGETGYCSRGGRTSNKRMNISAGASVSEAPVSFSYNIVNRIVTIRALLFI